MKRTNKKHQLFHRHFIKEGLSNFAGLFAWGLPIYMKFDDLDLVARSQVCQIHKQQIVF